jgi:hypothetical protein
VDLSQDDHDALSGARYADRVPMADRIRALVSYGARTRPGAGGQHPSPGAAASTARFDRPPTGPPRAEGSPPAS